MNTAEQNGRDPRWQVWMRNLLGSFWGCAALATVVTLAMEFPLEDTPGTDTLISISMAWLGHFFVAALIVSAVVRRTKDEHGWWSSRFMDWIWGLLGSFRGCALLAIPITISKMLPIWELPAEQMLIWTFVTWTMYTCGLGFFGFLMGHDIGDGGGKEANAGEATNEHK